MSRALGAGGSCLTNCGATGSAGPPVRDRVRGSGPSKARRPCRGRGGGGVHRSNAAVGAPYAITAFPAGELEGVGDAGAGAGGVRPGGEVGEGFADDGLRRVAEEFLGVLVPRRDGSDAVDLDDRDPDPAVGQREENGPQDGPAERMPTARSGRSSSNQTCFLRGRVLHAPAAASAAHN